MNTVFTLVARNRARPFAPIKLILDEIHKRLSQTVCIEKFIVSEIRLSPVRFGTERKALVSTYVSFWMQGTNKGIIGHNQITGLTLFMPHYMQEEMRVGCVD